MLSLPRLMVARLRQLRLAARARRFALSRAPRVRRLILMLHNRCAMRCRMCDLWQEPEASFPAERITELFRSRCLAPDASVHLTGGEPLLYPGFPEVYARVRGLAPRAKMSITTSGVPAAAVRGFLKGRPDLRRTTLIFSFDGIGTHDLQRGQPGAEAELLALLPEVRRAAPDAEIVLQYTITPWNAGAARPTAAKARELGLGIQFLIVKDHPEYTNSVRRPKDGPLFPWPPEVLDRLGADLRAVFNELSILGARHELAHLLRLVERLEGGNRDSVRPCCPVPSQSAFIRADGAVLTCRTRPPVGNALREGLDAALSSAAAQRLRREGCGACELRFSEF